MIGFIDLKDNGDDIAAGRGVEFEIGGEAVVVGVVVASYLGKRLTPINGNVSACKGNKQKSIN